MITPNDVQHIVGAVYSALGDLPKEVVLGERLLDVKSKSKRDVDVAVIRTDRRDILAAEVKARRRKLDTETVEGLCCKLGDMPVVSEKAIVSLSGFTKPALRKAMAYGVRCFDLKRGCALPVFRSIDISQMKSIELATTEWSEGPHIKLLLDRELLPYERAALRKNTRVVYPSGGPSPINLDELQVRMITAAQGMIVITETPAPIAVRIQITDEPPLRLKTGKVRVEFAEITGVIRRVVHSVNPTDMFYLSDEMGTALGGAVVAELGGELVSLAVGRDSNTLHITYLPARVRAVRPTRRRIYPVPAA